MDLDGDGRLWWACWVIGASEKACSLSLSCLENEAPLPSEEATTF